MILKCDILKREICDVLKKIKNKTILDTFFLANAHILKIKTRSKG